VALVSIGGKSEAQIDVAELKDEDGDIEVSIGDRLQAIVVSTSGGVILSRNGVGNAATQRELESAFRAGLAVEGRVESAIKGGYEIRIARERAFCPLSQIDIIRTTDPAVHVGKAYTFQIVEYKDWLAPRHSRQRPRAAVSSVSAVRCDRSLRRQSIPRAARV
jgi:small subunit ribosomal protein S1